MKELAGLGMGAGGRKEEEIDEIGGTWPRDSQQEAYFMQFPKAWPSSKSKLTATFKWRENHWYS